MSAFFIVASLVLLGMQMVVGGWLYFVFPKIGWKIPVLLLPVLCTLLFRWGMSYTRYHYGNWESVLYFFCYTWVGLVFLAFCICAFCALLQWILFFFHITARGPLGTASLTLIAVVWTLSLWGGLRSPQIKTVDLKIPGAPSFTAGVISDSHLGTGVSVERFDIALQRLQAQKPDAVFVLGDFFEYGPNKKAYAKLMKDFKAPLGVYGVLGNHEYYVGYEASVQLFKDSGITLLQNQSVTLPNGVEVIGVNDIKTTRITPAQFEKILGAAKPSAFTILLSHQPLYAKEASAKGMNLMLSGHTHNGQIFPFNFLVKLQYSHVYGPYSVDGMHGYVTSGMFYWGIPLRLFAPSEIPLLRINS